METSLDAGRPLTRGARFRERTWIPGKPSRLGGESRSVTKAEGLVQRFHQILPGPSGDIEPAILIGDALGIKDGRRLPQRLTRGGCNAGRLCVGKTLL